MEQVSEASVFKIFERLLGISIIDFRTAFGLHSDSKSIGFLGEILHLLKTYNLMPYLHLWQRVSIFPSYRKLKQTVNSRIFKHERAYFLTASEENPVLKLTLTCICQLFTLKLLVTYWNNPDLVSKIQTQIRLLVNAGLRGSVPWLQGRNNITCPLFKPT